MKNCFLKLRTGLTLVQKMIVYPYGRRRLILHLFTEVMICSAINFTVQYYNILLNLLVKKTIYYAI